VRLSDEGIDLYKRISADRPLYTRKEPDGEKHCLYFFDCSPDQLLIYFRRFPHDSAEIISPASLRQEMITFHKEALSAYGEDV